MINSRRYFNSNFVHLARGSSQSGCVLIPPPHGLFRVKIQKDSKNIPKVCLLFLTLNKPWGGGIKTQPILGLPLARTKLEWKYLHEFFILHIQNISVTSIFGIVFWIFWKLTFLGKKLIKKPWGEESRRCLQDGQIDLKVKIVSLLDKWGIGTLQIITVQLQSIYFWK